MAMRLSDNFQLAQDWQLRKPLPESMLCLLRAEQFADVWFMCKDQDRSDKADRVAAHKLILAARSPVFEAMFYGELAESDTEIELPDIEKIPFLLFLRCLYSDDTDLSEDNAVEVMKIAHKYQVTTCLEFCSEFLQGILKADNACCLLEHARLLDDKALVRAAVDFTDDNASAVINSEGFKDISPETLEYILKGNTFFAPEAEIVKAVFEWASNYLSKNEMAVNSTNKRLVMDKAFYWLRLPTLGLHDFFSTQMKYDYLTNDEQLNIIRYIVLKETHDVGNSLEQRRPRKETYIRSVLECQEPKEIIPNETLTNVFTLTCKHNIELEEILLLQRQDQLKGAKCIVETSFDKTVLSVHEITFKQLHRDLKLEPPVQLKASINPYNIKVTITKPYDFNPAVSMHIQSSAGGPFGGFSFGVAQQTVRKSVSVQTEGDQSFCGSWMIVPSLLSLECKDWQSCFIRGIKYTNESCRDQR